MKYVEYVNSLLKDKISNQDNLVIFGQNIDAGSCLSGLTRGLSSVNNGLTINSQNSENSLIGSGFGLMMRGISSIFFMKQLDFLLLGVDQLVNTHNVISQIEPKASFTIFPITVDSGYEGPQSFLNNIDDFCSISGVDGFSFTNKNDANKIIEKYLVKPGFRILSTGQRLLQQETLDLELIDQEINCNYFQYKRGSESTIVCFNHSLNYGLELYQAMKLNNLSSSLFSINIHSHKNFRLIFEDLKKTKCLILIDDARSNNLVSDRFLHDALDKCHLNKKIIISRLSNRKSTAPNKDILDIDYDKIIDQINN